MLLRGMAALVITVLLLVGCGEPADGAGGEPWLEPANYSYELTRRLLLETS